MLRSHKILFALTNFLVTYSVFAMESQSELIPVLLSSKPAPWSKNSAPNTFDASLTTTATRNDYETFVTSGSTRKHYIGMKGQECTLSPDGIMLALPERSFKIDTISIWDTSNNKEKILRSNGNIAHITISNNDASTIATVENSEPSLIKFHSFDCSYTWKTLKIDNGIINKLSLNANGTLLAVVLKPKTDQDFSSNVVMIIDLDTNLQVATIASRNKNIVNLAFGEHLVLEYEEESGNRLIKTVALFDSTKINEHQHALLKSIQQYLNNPSHHGLKAAILLDYDQKVTFDSLPEEYKNVLTAAADFMHSEL